MVSVDRKKLISRVILVTLFAGLIYDGLTTCNWLDIRLNLSGCKLVVDRYYGNDLIFSNDGGLFATGGIDFQVWDANKLVPIFQTDNPITNRGLISFSDDASLIAVMSDDHTSQIEVFNIGASTLVKSIDAESVLSLKFIPNTKKIVVSSWEDSRLKIKDVVIGEMVGESPKLGHHAYKIDFLNGMFLITTAYGLDVRDSQDFSLLNRISVGKDFQDSIVSPNGSLVAFGIEGEAVQIWDIKTATELYSFSITEYSQVSLDFTPDSKYLLIGVGNTYYLWDFSGDKILDSRNIESHIIQVAVSPKGNSFVILTKSSLIIFELRSFD